MIIAGERGEFRLRESIVLGMVQFFAPILPRRLRANPASTIARVALEAVVNPRPGVHVVFTQDLTARG